MKNATVPVCLAWLAASSMLSAGAPGVRADDKAAARMASYDGEIVKIWSVQKNKATSDKVTVVDIHLDGGNVDFEDVRIRFDAATGAAEHAWWKTKGNFEIALPKERLQLKNIPQLHQDVAVTFDHDVPEEASGAAGAAGLRLVSLVQQKPPAAAPIR